ncbi:MAG: hypothetical protein ACYS22_14335 [Planctomycetota bacterium]|jgi:hypothetical protein
MSREHLLTCLASIWLGFAGCGCEDAANASFDDVKSGLAAKEQARALVVVGNAKKKVQAFQIAQGRNPSSLEELEESQGVLQTPPRGKRWDYDPETGRVGLGDG